MTHKSQVEYTSWFPQDPNASITKALFTHSIGEIQQVIKVLVRDKIQKK